MKKALPGIIIILICSFAQAQDWNQLSNTPFLRHHSNGFGVDDKAYVFAGVWNNSGPTSQSSEMWEYIPLFDTWNMIDDFPGQARGIAIGDEWNGKYYYGFGTSSSSYLTDLWEFDPADMSFTQLPSCPCTGRSHPAFVAHNDKIYMGSGSTNNGDLKDWWEYDMQTQIWTQKEDIPGDNRHHPFQFAIDDFIYVGGGHAFNWSKYDMVNEVWSAINSEPDGRVAGSQIQHNGKGYLIGGDDANHVHVVDSESFMQYDPDQDEWTLLPQLPNGSRWANSTFIIGDNLYYFGGLSDVINDDQSMWVFDLSIYNTIDSTIMDTTMVDTTMIDTTSTNVFEINDPFITASPNPFDEYLFINGNSEADKIYELTIFDSQGKVRFHQQDFYLRTEINLEEVEDPGIYFLQLFDGSTKYNLKLLKE